MLIILLVLSLLGRGDVFERITIEDGLSQNMVNDILLDRNGFLWFATKDGLNRFDGYEFVVYRNYPGQLESLTSNHITSLVQTSDGAIWMTTFGGGLNRLDPGSGLAEPILNSDLTDVSYATHLHLDSRQQLWVLSQADGLVRLEQDSREFTPLRRLPGMTSVGDISNFALTASDFIWTGSSQMIQFIRPDEAILRQWHVPDPRLRPTSIIALSDTVLLFATRTGLEFVHVTDSSLHHRSTRVQHESFGFGTTLMRDVQGRIWLATLTDMYQYDPQSDQLRWLFRHETRPTSAMISDNSGIVWMGTAGWGLIRYNPARQHLRRGSGPLPPVVVPELLAALERSGAPTIDWNVATDHALHRREPDEIWLSMAGFQVFRYRFSDGSLRRYQANPMLRRQNISRGFNRIFAEPDGPVWLAGSGGVFALDPESGLFTYHPVYQDAQPDQEHLNRTGYPDITSITSDAAGMLWIGTPDRGLARYYPQTRQLQWFRHDAANPSSISSDQILSLEPDPFDPTRYLWVGTEGGGINRLDLSTERFERLFTTDGLPSMVIYAILPDQSGFLWLSTNNGLARLHPKTLEIRSFSTVDGLHSREFNRFEYYKGSDGSLYFGGIGGYTHVIPGAYQPNNHEPRLRLTNFLLFNKPVPSVLAQQHHESTGTRIQLRYDENVITFEFAALEFTAPGNNRYRYRMNGFDRDWIDAGTSRAATYTNLAPGTYTFHVQAANSDGRWSPTELQIPLQISPPFWMTLWFRLLVTLLMVTLVGLAVQLRIRKLRREKQHQEEVTLRVIEKQEEERRRIAHEMHDGLGQELLILKNMLYRWATRPDTAAPETVLQTASDQIGGILRNVREITHNLRPPELDRIGITETVRYTLEKSSSAAGLHLNAEIYPFNGAIAPEHEINLVRIVQELLTNTIRHAGATEVSCTITLSGKKLLVHYHDNGRGIPAEVDTNTLRGGLGLSGISERVRILGGSIAWQGSGGPGLMVDIRIPVSGEMR
jgi:signal transduction histidine kinase/ligand-binding sensor domain-containing protein